MLETTAACSLYDYTPNDIPFEAACIWTGVYAENFVGPPDDKRGKFLPPPLSTMTTAKASWPLINMESFGVFFSVCMYFCVCFSRE